MNPAVFLGLILVLGAALIVSGVGLLLGTAYALITAGAQLLGLAILLRGGRTHGA
ncbi:MAG TPA: hypothetical protein VFS02_22555 [Telluria sp.]|nr:hypothetical protein [Telluria sp.]